MRFWLLALGGLALDLWSKHWAFSTLGQGGRKELIANTLELQTMMNDGALFGIGSGQTTLFLVASVLALALVFWMFACSTSRNRLLHIAFGAILAGAAGNMYDRIMVRVVAMPGPGGAPRFYEMSSSADGQLLEFRPYGSAASERPLIRPAASFGEPPKAVGHVRDFLKIPTRWLGGRELWPWVFNVADMLLVGGVGILALRLWLDRGTARQPAAALDSVTPNA